jgi:hypothetical protein
MKTAINIDITYDQVLAIVKSLPTAQKVKLSRELEKEGIRTKLTGLLSAFKTDAPIEEDIKAEAELVRKAMYDS